MDLQQKVQNVLDRAVENGTECGCQAALFVNGKLEVNAFTGWTDWTQTQKVDENTIFPIYSTGKAPSSTVLHRLVEMGKLTYHTRIADFWPEFGCNGKEEMEVWHVLSYRAGLFQIPESTPEERTDFQLMTSKMAAAAPAYPPGTKQQYHPATYGWLTGGIACHVLNDPDYPGIFRKLVGEPAGMDRFFYGIDPEKEHNIASLVPGKDGQTYSKEHQERMNKPMNRACCNPSSAAMSNALSIARHYAALDTGLLSAETIANAIRPWRAADDPLPLVKGRWELFGLGYVLSGPPQDVSCIFGHGGVGGSEGLLDRKRHYAIAITRNCFAGPNVLVPFYEALDFKNRDWPDTAEVPGQAKRR